MEFVTGNVVLFGYSVNIINRSVSHLHEIMDTSDNRKKKKQTSKLQIY